MGNSVLASLFVILTVAHGFCPAQGTLPPQDHLERAIRLANAYNWVDAAPHFVEAERLFSAAGDEERAYQARIGRMRSTTQRGSLPQVIVELAEDLDSLPFLQT